MYVGVVPLETQLPMREEKQRNKLAHTPLCSLLHMLNTEYPLTSAKKTAKEGPGKKPWADEVDSDKNLNQLLSQHPQKADEGHIQEVFHRRKMQF